VLKSGLDSDSRTMGDKSNILDSKDSQIEFSEFDRKRIDFVGEDTEYGDETQSLLAMEERSNYSQIPFGFQSRGSYKHASKNCEIVGGTANSLMFSNFNDKFASPALVSRVIISFLPPSVFPSRPHLSPPIPLVSRVNDLKSSKNFEYYFVHPDYEFRLIYVVVYCARIFMYKLTILFVHAIYNFSSDAQFPV